MLKKAILILTALASLTMANSAQAAPPPSTTPVSVVNTPNVIVANTTANPVPINATIVEADNPARNAAQQQINIVVTGSGTGSGSVTIPAGKIFVLEFVAYSLSFLPVNDPTLQLSMENLSISVNGPHIDGSNGPIEYQLPIPTSGGNRGGGSGNQLLRLYAQPGTLINVSFTVQNQFATQAISASVSLSGYFVNP